MSIFFLYLEIVSELRLELESYSSGARKNSYEVWLAPISILTGPISTLMEIIRLALQTAETAQGIKLEFIDDWEFLDAVDGNENLFDYTGEDDTMTEEDGWLRLGHETSLYGQASPSDTNRPREEKQPETTNIIQFDHDAGLNHPVSISANQGWGLHQGDVSQSAHAALADTISEEKLDRVPCSYEASGRGDGTGFQEARRLEEEIGGGDAGDREPGGEFNTGAALTIPVSPGRHEGFTDLIKTGMLREEPRARVRPAALGYYTLGLLERRVDRRMWYHHVPDRRQGGPLDPGQ